MGWWRETIDIVKENDPAARTTLEVLLTYPGVKALAAHRLSHFLWKHGFKLLARMHSQFWRFLDADRDSPWCSDRIRCLH